MASPIEAILILCDSAVADPSGKVHMLGAGWSTTGSPTAPQAVVAMLKIPWDRANQPQPLQLQLLNSDGVPVTVSTPEGPMLLGTEGAVEVGRPPGLAHGSSLDSPFVLSVPPLPLPPGRYEWRLTISGQHFTASFQVHGVQ